MAQWHPVTNLRTNIVHHPPVVVFFICLLVISGAFIGIGIYSQSHDIKNPDISMDWNQMLRSIANLKFCTHLNTTESLSGKQEEDSPPLLYHGDISIINASQETTDVVQMFLLVPLVHIGDERNHNSFSATILGSQLGLRDAGGKALFNISLFLQIQSQSSATESGLDPKLPTYSGTKPRSCLKITAPRHLLPQTPSPPVCPTNENLEKDLSPVRAVAIESYKQRTPNAPPCLSLEFTPESTLTVLLTQEEKALAKYHLMLFSVVLLAVCSMMGLIGTLTCSRSRRHLAKGLHSQKDTFLGS